MQILNTDGEAVVSSTGFAPEEGQAPDYLARPFGR